MSAIFIVVGNVGEHSGFITEENLDHIWSSENPGGWTYQQVCGLHGNVLAECDTEAEARTELASFLECDAFETGRYCYTHNPDV